MRKQLPSSSFLAPLTVLAALDTTAQDFAPFTPDSRKLFGVVPGYTSTFGIAFDSTTVDAGTTIHHNYKTVWDTLTTTSCAFWVGSECYKQDRPTWAGPRVEVDDQGTHTLFNLWGEPIVLHFSTEPGSQTPIYTDADEQFLLSYAGEAPGNILGLEENVRHWTILHQDLDGQPINSVLNNAPVDVGATAGLVRYFRVDSFPLLLRPVELVGQSEPPLGLHTITPAFLHDYQPGDEVQVHDYANYYVGPPWLDNNTYVKRTVISRTDSPTEVTYGMVLVSYDADSGIVISSTATEIHSKTEVIATIPFDRFDGTQPSLAMEDYCGLPLWTYRTYLNQGLGYCPEENCWGGYDTNGPPPYGGSTLVGGLGTYASSASIMQPTGYSTSNTIVYFKKNGVECFNEVVMGVTGHSGTPGRVTVAPNPVDDAFRYEASGPVAVLEVRNAQGRIMTKRVLPGRSGTVATASWPVGVYVLRLDLADGGSGSRRLVVSR